MQKWASGDTASYPITPKKGKIEKRRMRVLNMILPPILGLDPALLVHLVAVVQPCGWPLAILAGQDEGDCGGSVYG